ncbi:Uncharacterized protein pbN1_38460 [Aromatoleum bremense]|nr:Uncharacterized protein pbN1_38460 [Aromatoleum bremense]
MKRAAPDCARPAQASARGTAAGHDRKVYRKGWVRLPIFTPPRAFLATGLR